MRFAPLLLVSAAAFSFNACRQPVKPEPTPVPAAARPANGAPAPTPGAPTPNAPAPGSPAGGPGGGAAPGNGHRHGRALALLGSVVPVARAADEGEGQQAGDEHGKQAAPEKNSTGKF